MEWSADFPEADGVGWTPPHVAPQTLDSFLRSWARVKTSGATGPRLIRRRSIAARVVAGIVVLHTAFIQLFTIPWLVGLITGRTAPDSLSVFSLFLLFFVNLPILLWGVGVLRCRTVLSAHGIDMRRLFRTERRPWPATRSGFALSEREIDLSNPESSFHYRVCRLMLVNGGPDDVMRMPGCIFGGTFQFFSKDCVTRARFALEGIWAFAVGQGWIVPDVGTVRAEPELAESSRNARSIQTARSSASGPLIYGAPAWRRVREFLFDGGLLLLCAGVVFGVIGVLALHQPGGETKTVLIGLGGLVLGLAGVMTPLVRMRRFFRKTIVDRGAIRAGWKEYPWPGSRSSLYVAGDRVFMVDGGGRAVPLPGTGGGRGGFARREALAASQCEEIWRWGTANGATRESGRYIPLRFADWQREREVFEARAGLRPMPG